MLQIKLFGSPDFKADNQHIDISRRKAAALFIYLVVTRRPHSRDHLCTLLWSEADTTAARAELRRMLSTLNHSALGQYIEADRHSVKLIHTDAIEVDFWRFDQILNEGDWITLSSTLESWLLPFLQGFNMSDAPEFDDWQQLMNTQIRQRLIPVLEQLVMQSQGQQTHHETIRLLRAWLMIDEDHEGVHRWLMRCYAEAGQAANALVHYQQLRQQLKMRYETEPEAETQQLAEQIRAGQPIDTHTFAGGVLPPLPQLLIRRENVLNTLREKLINRDTRGEKPLVVIQGWPGIGKTALTAVIAHDALIQRHFKDGILWVSLGQSPDIFASLVKWGNALKLPGIQQAKSMNDASQILNSALHDKNVLVIVDDVWDETHFRPFDIGGKGCAILVTSRLNRVAQAIITRRDELYKIPVLDEEQGLALLNTLAPDVVKNHDEEIRELVRDLEGLPLALQVVGRLLREEHILGWGVKELLTELHEGTRLLEARAPLDRQQSEDDVPTTVAALLEMSTNALDEVTRKHFALLGVFAPKPAVFELGAMEAVWEVEDGRPTVRRLVERGLLEVVPGGEFQMHALLVQHARMMFGGVNAV